MAGEPLDRRVNWRSLTPAKAKIPTARLKAITRCWNCSELGHCHREYLYLTDVVVLRNEGDPVNFLGLEITETSRGFEVENSTDLVESMPNLLRVGKLETDCQSKWTLYSDGARNSNSTGSSRLLQLPHNRRKTLLHVTLVTRHAVRRPTTIHTSPQSHNRE